MTISPNAHQWIEEFVAAYPEKTQNLRRYLPKIAVSQDALQVLAVKYDTTSVDITSTTGAPVEIPVSYTEDTITVVNLSARTPEMDARLFSNKDVVVAQSELILKQFLQNENKMVLNTLSTAPVNTITVDTSADTAEPTVAQTYLALEEAIFNVEVYSTAPKLLVISPDIKKYLFAPTPELNKPMNLIKENEINVVQDSTLSNTAYLLPLEMDVCKLVQVKDLVIQIEQLPYEMAAIYGKEAVAFLLNQPQVVQKLDFTTQ